jgi:hypothetical protein
MYSDFGAASQIETNLSTINDVGLGLLSNSEDMIVNGQQCRCKFPEICESIFEHWEAVLRFSKIVLEILSLKLAPSSLGWLPIL